jgi:hypothetical protein
MIVKCQCFKANEVLLVIGKIHGLDDRPDITSIDELVCHVRGTAVSCIDFVVGPLREMISSACRVCNAVLAELTLLQESVCERLYLCHV